MTEYPPGTVLTCTHEDCPCRVRIESECHCQSAGEPYRCTCGAPMVAVLEHGADTSAPLSSDRPLPD
jgi:hypothetical protein